MHIVFVDTTLTTPPTGGAQTFLVTLARELVNRGWRVTVVAHPGPERAIVEALRKSGTEVVEVLWRSSDLPEERAERLASWVNEHSPAAYVVSISPDIGWLALPLLDPRISTLSIAHCDVSAFYEPVAHYCSLIDCAVSVSEEIHRKTIAECNIPPPRARYIPYGIDHLQPDEIEARCATQDGGIEPIRIGYVGRLEQFQKRVMDFVPLTCELKRRGVKFELHLIGEGNDRNLLEEEFQRQLPGAAVKFWGWLSPQEVRQRLSELDVFVLMSAFEGLPVALLEAMGQGVVPVVSRIASGSTQVVCDGENGYVVTIGDVVTFAERLQTLAGDTHLLRSMKAAAWETSREFSAERMVERYIDTFHHFTAAEFSREHRKAVPQPYPVMQSCKSAYPIWLRKLKRRFLTRANAVQMLLFANYRSHLLG
jgi:glycosyltransferase involved in cell wall biosynthesis